MRTLSVLALLLILPMSAFSYLRPQATGVAAGDACVAALENGSRASQAPLPAVFGLLSWNIRKGLDHGWEADLAMLGESAHLVFLQEARPGRRLDALLQKLPHQYFAPGFSLAGRPTGVLTASASASAMQCTLRSIEPWLGTPKATAVNLYAVGSRRSRLLAINLHGINLSVGTRVFRDQMQALEPLLGAHAGPVILGGDINAWSAARLAALDALAARHDLQRVNFQPDLRSRIVGLAMDYVYIRGLEIVLAEALPVTSSDHNPLLLKLALPVAE